MSSSARMGLSLWCLSEPTLSNHSTHKCKTCAFSATVEFGESVWSTVLQRAKNQGKLIYRAPKILAFSRLLCSNSPKATLTNHVIRFKSSISICAPLEGKGIPLSPSGMEKHSACAEGASPTGSTAMARTQRLSCHLGSGLVQSC